MDHFGGLSVWRGLFKKTTGTVVLDTKAMTGSADITIDAASIDLAHDKLNEHVSGPEILDVSKYPTATYKGTSIKFKGEELTTATRERMREILKPRFPNVEVDCFDGLLVDYAARRGATVRLPRCCPSWRRRPVSAVKKP